MLQFSLLQKFTKCVRNKANHYKEWSETCKLTNSDFCTDFHNLANWLTRGSDKRIFTISSCSFYLNCSCSICWLCKLAQVEAPLSWEHKLIRQIMEKICTICIVEGRQLEPVSLCQPNAAARHNSPHWSWDAIQVWNHLLSTKTSS